MGSLKEIRRIMVGACREKLGASGWAYVGQTDSVDFTMARSAEVSYELGFGLEGLTTYGLLPGIGIRHVTISELCSRFMGLPVSRVCAFGRGLGDLLIADGIKSPGRRWRAVSVEDVDRVAAQLRDDIDAYGMVFARPYTMLADVIRGLEQQRRYQALSGNLAIGRALAGDMTGAAAALAEYAVPRHRHIPEGSLQFTGFLREFVDYFGMDRRSLPAEVLQYL
jgi:hypothetical protein